MNMGVDKDEQELLEDFRGLSPANKSYMLSLAHALKGSQETSVKSMGSTRMGSCEEKAHGKPAA